MNINAVVNYNSFVGQSVLVAARKSKKDARSASDIFKSMKSLASRKPYLFDQPIDCKTTKGL